MTITQLIKKLEDIKKKAGPRAKVTVAAKEMLESCNGVFDIIDINSIETKYVNICDGDGFAIINKDGSQRGHTQVVLSS